MKGRRTNGIGLAIVGAGRVGLFRGEVAARHPRLRIIMDHLGARTTQKDDLLKDASESTATSWPHSRLAMTWSGSDCS